MKKFLSKILIFILIVATMSLGVNFVYIKRDRAESQSIGKFKKIPESVKVCNFGSSHGLYSFNYEEIKDIGTFNFALSSQLPSYDKRIFDCYKDKISEGAVVFIPVSYFSLYGCDETETEEFPKMNKRYYQILPPSLIKEYDLKTHIYSKYFPALSNGGDLFKILAFGTKDTVTRKWAEKATDIDVKRHAASACEDHIFKNKLDGSGKRIVNVQEVNALKDLINACKEKNCTPVLITTPFLSEYTDEIKRRDPAFFDDFYKQVGNIVEETGVSYYDYGFDERFVHNYGIFMNSDHLNSEGAKLFVKILMDEVVHYGKSDSLISG